MHDISLFSVKYLCGTYGRCPLCARIKALGMLYGEIDNNLLRVKFTFVYQAFLLQTLTCRYTVRWPMRYAVLPDNYRQISQQEAKLSLG